MVAIIDEHVSENVFFVVELNRQPELRGLLVGERALRHDALGLASELELGAHRTELADREPDVGIRAVPLPSHPRGAVVCAAGEFGNGDLERADSLILLLFDPIDVLKRNKEAIEKLNQQISQAEGIIEQANADMAGNMSDTS